VNLFGENLKMRKLNAREQSGFTLIECIIAIVLIMVGLLAVYSLVVYSIQTQKMSSDLVRANSLARQKVEELKNTVRVPGGSLTSNTTNYFDTPLEQYTRRWQVVSDSIGTQTISVTVIPNSSLTLQAQVLLTTKMR
jgi:prepilin-type N-terminal cleavage/methylation domain-containing protein